MHINTVIFDLDGTLLNTLEDLCDSVNYALEKSDYPIRSLEEVRTFVGNGVRKLIERSVPLNASNDCIDQCLTIFKEHYSNNMRIKTRPYEGIYETLHSLKEQGYKLAIVSNKFDKAVKELCKDYYNEFIQVAIGESKGVNKKPAPDSVFAAIKELNSSLEDSIYVGDSEVDVQTAHNAGIPCIGVTWGFRTKEVLKAEGADFIIDESEELIKCLNKLS